MVEATWPLIGRDNELRLIADAIRGGGAVLAGPAGVGKTRLLREALTGARGRHCRLVIGTESAREVPLGAFAEFAKHLDSEPLGQAQAVVAAVAAPGSDVVLGVDDAHLLDDLSALVVHQIARSNRVAVLITLREGMPAPDAVTGLWKDEVLPRMEIQPLSRTHTAELLTEVLGDDVHSATARRLWDYTRGNSLFLRQLVDDEIAANRLVRRADMWVWDGEPSASPRLSALVESMIGRQPDEIVAVLEVLAVADRLRIAVLVDLVGPGAVNAAETRGLITVESRPGSPVARLAHPIFGDVTRARAGAARLRSLRGRVAARLACDEEDPVGLVSRAALVTDSDLEPDPVLLESAAHAATQLSDTLLSERLARASVAAGGGASARLAHARALATCERGPEAVAILAQLVADAATDAERVRLTLLRAAIDILVNDAADEAAQCLAAIANQVDDVGMRASYDCVGALLLAAKGVPRRAADLAQTALRRPEWVSEDFLIVGIDALAIGLGEIGALDRIDDASDSGYLLTRRSFPIANYRVQLARRHITGLRLGGRLGDAGRIADELTRSVREGPFANTVGPILSGSVALSIGDLAEARRLLREGISAGPSDRATAARGYGHILLATCLGMSGDHAGAAAALTTAPTRGRPELPLDVPDRVLARAWVHAAGGAVGDAITVVLNTAAAARRADRPARELECLQAAAQFGDATGASRVRDLAGDLQGPRVHAVALHTAALFDADGAALLEAASRYEEFGDRIAAADAAAQAAMALRAAGLRTRSLNASATAQRLALATGASTPALRAGSAPLPLTPRQREIISLVATGFTNREIAERLFMSIRTVEGHLLRSCRRVGVNSREELASLLDGFGFASE